MSEFKEGDIVRFKSNQREFELEDINENPNWREDDEYWASGYSRWGSEEVDNPDDIELVMSAADAAARTLPTPREIIMSLDLTGGHGDVVDIDATEIDGDDLWAYGTAENGLRVGFRVSISRVFEADD